MDLPPNDPSVSSSESDTRPGSRRTKLTTDSITNILAVPESPGEVELPENLADLGRALDKALRSDGDVNQAYGAFADKAFGDPNAARAASCFVASLFKGQQGMLVNLVRTKDMLAALQGGSSELARVVAARWHSESLTQRIARFGESLVLNKDTLGNPDAAGLMMAIAGLMALSKPDRAAALFKLAREHTKDPGGEELAEGVQAMLSAGELIEPLPPEERAVWQQRLRSPDKNADWSSPEACKALDALAGKLKPEMACAALFEAAVPDAWWKEKVMGVQVPPPAPEQKEPVPPTEAKPAPKVEEKQVPEFEANAEPTKTPSPSEPASTKVEIEKESPPPTTDKPVSAQVEDPKEIKAEPPTPVEPKPTPGAAASPAISSTVVPVTRPSGVLTFLTGQLFGMILVAIVWSIQPDLLSRFLSAAKAPSPPLVAEVKAGKPTPATTAKNGLDIAEAAHGTSPATSPGDQWCSEEIARLAAAHAPLKPWIGKALDGTWTECRDLVSGQVPVAYPNADEYDAYLRWLLLAKPRDQETRRAVPRLLVRFTALEELLELCEHLSFPGSAYQGDVTTMAEIGLEMHTTLISHADRQRLKKFAGKE